MAFNGTMIGNLSWTTKPSPQNYAVRFPGDETLSRISFGDIDVFRQPKGFTVFLAFFVNDIDTHWIPLLEKNPVLGDSDLSNLTTRYDDWEISINYTVGSIAGDNLPAQVNKSSLHFVLYGLMTSKKNPNFLQVHYHQRSCFNKQTLVAGFNTVAATYNGKGKQSGMKLYCNGVRVDNSPSQSYTTMLNVNHSPEPLLIGGNGVNYTTANQGYKVGFDGDFVRVGFWSKALSASAIKRLHEDPYQV